MLTITILLALSAASRADSIRLHDQVGSRGPDVLLREVAQLDGPAALALADVVVARLPDQAGAVSLRMADLEKMLATRGVNLAKLSLRGFETCQVQRLKPEPGPTNAEPAPALSNPATEVTPTAALTLRDRVVELIEKLAGAPRSDLRINFADADGKVLAQSALEDRFEIEPAGAVPGRVPLVIRRYKGDLVAETYRVTADVARRGQGVVLLKAISRGQTIAPSDVEARDVYVDSARTEPATSVSAVVGMTATAALKAGTAVLACHVQSPAVVKRGDLITVRCVSGGLVLRTVARAVEDGIVGQVITARHDQTRQTFNVKVTGAREAAVVAAEPAQAARAGGQGDGP